MAQKVIARGADWLSGSMPYPAFKRAGYSFVMRYAVPSIQDKMISPAEILTAHNAGVAVGFIYETTGNSWTGGTDAGTADGNEARSALRSIGAPDTVACYLAIDSPVADTQLTVVLDYLASAEKALAPYRMGVYGQWSVVRTVAGLYPDACLWQTAAWSNGLVYDNLNMFQDDQTSLLGIHIDTDSLFKADSGLWEAAVSSPLPSQPKEDADMIIVHVDGSPDVYLYDGTMHHVTSPANEAAFVKVLPSVTIDETQFEELAGGSKP